MVGDEGVTVYRAEVYSDRNGWDRVFQRRKLLVSDYFATREEAHAFTTPYFHQGYGTQIIDVGYIPTHPVESAHDEHILVGMAQQEVKDYYGDDYEGWRWEEQHAEMVRIEEAKRKRRDNITKDNGAPF